MIQERPLLVSATMSESSISAMSLEADCKRCRVRSWIEQYQSMQKQTEASICRWEGQAEHNREVLEELRGNASTVSSARYDALILWLEREQNKTLSSIQQLKQHQCVTDMYHSLVSLTGRYQCRSRERNVDIRESPCCGIESTDAMAPFGEVANQEEAAREEARK